VIVGVYPQPILNLTMETVQNIVTRMFIRN